MAGNQFAKYIKLIDLFRSASDGHLSFDEIDALWRSSYVGEGQPLAKRTFHNYRDAIFDTFGLKIELDKSWSHYKYHIVESENNLHGNSIRSWAMDSFSILNQLNSDKSLEDKIQYEETPSGSKWPIILLKAIGESKVVEMTYHKFGDPAPNTFKVEPYLLKVSNRRWYVVVRALHYVQMNEQLKKEGKLDELKDTIRVYSLDRIKNIEILDEKFKPNKNFNSKEYFDGSVGVYSSGAPKQKVVIRAYDKARDYMETLPFHHSQKIESKTNDYTDFSITVRPTFDFKQLILQQGTQVEVLSPDSLRNEIKEIITKMLERYK